MKLKLLLPILAAALAAAVIVLLPRAPAPPQSDATPAAVHATDPRPENLPSVDDDAALVENYGPEPGTEIVHGLRVRKDRNCTIEPRFIDIGDGNVVKAFACVPHAEPGPGFYDIYDNATLAKLAYSDGGAAEELGKRISEEDPEAARAMMMRSVALRPENTDPLLWLATQNYSRIATNGEPAMTEMQEKYLLTRVAEELGEPEAASHIRQQLEIAGASEAMFEHLERQVQWDLKEIRDIQIEVTGESVLPEVAL